MMAQQAKSEPIKEGDTIPRTIEYFPFEGFLNGFKWDSNNKSGLAFIGITRTFGQGENAKKNFYTARIRVWNRDAHCLSDMASWLNEDANKDESVFIHASARWASFERTTGKKWGKNNEKDEMESLMYFEGKEVFQIDPKTRSVLYVAAKHLLPEEQLSQA
jgi:hypothetical protein